MLNRCLASLPTEIMSNYNGDFCLFLQATWLLYDRNAVLVILLYITSNIIQ